MANRTSSRFNREAALGGSDQSGRLRSVSDGDHVANNRLLTEFEDKDGPRLLTTALCLEDNSSAHRTDEYECDVPVIRRGQEFNLALTLDRKYNAETDKIFLQFVVGARPVESKETIMRVKVTKKMDTKKQEWQANVASVDKKKLTLVVWSPADAIVGVYSVYVETKVKDGDKKWKGRKEFKKAFILVFNPWCEDDLVYMEKDDWRKEYVLNETGRIWKGSANYHFGEPWYFGQFESVSIEAALYLLDKAELSDGARSNPTLVVRTISQMSNCNDADGGVLAGRWTEKYPENCTVPWEWVGSVAILEEFMRTKKAVCFGQCWVFSGLVTTLLRALGIGTRSVTNFASAHDCDGSATIDYHWDEDGKPAGNNDSVWNYHVWNESWFKRVDLPDGNDGWQAHDATPQEASEGVMKCGPAPVKAIKEGLVYLPYDAKFIFAEVNADKVYWQVNKDGTMEVLALERQCVGVDISTKMVGSNGRHDVTSDYKYPEGSADERRAVHRAFRYSSRKEHRVYDVKAPEITFTLDCPSEVNMGDNFKVKVNMKNTEDAPRDAHINISVVASFYTGIPSEEVCHFVHDETLARKAENTAKFAIKHDMYEKILKPEATMTVYMKGTVKQTGRSFAKIATIDVKKPELVVKHPEQVKLGEEFELKIKFTNPLAEELTNGKFMLEGRGFAKTRTVKLSYFDSHGGDLCYSKAIGGKEDFVHKIKLTASHKGHREVAVNFSSNQLTGLTGSAVINVI